MEKNASTNNVVLCIVDIGGNSIKLESKMASGNKPDSKHKSLFKKLKNNCALAESISDTGSMSTESMGCALTTLKQIEERIKEIQSHGYNVVVKAIGTAPFRDAKNGAELKERIERETDIPLEIINGSEEAEYAAQGVIEKFPNISAIITDVGGGSADFAMVKNGKILKTHGLPLGNLRIKFADDAKSFIQEYLDTLPDEFKNSGLPLIATGGTFRTISKSFSGIYTQYEMDQENEIDIKYLSGYTNSIAYAISAHTDKEEDTLAEQFNIKKARLSLVEPASLLLRYMAEKLSIKKIMLSSASMRDGIRAEMRQNLAKEKAQNTPKNANNDETKPILPANTNNQPEISIAL